MAGLSSESLRIARALAATLFDPGTGEPVPEARLQWMSDELAHYASCAGPRTSSGVTAIFRGLQMLPPVVLRKRATFTSLTPEDRMRYLEKVETSRLLAPLLATAKIVLCMIYFEHPDVLREAGVTPTCLKEGA